MIFKKKKERNREGGTTISALAKKIGPSTV